jgi:2-amino-4-hydroxy-6-hydroxymethyldihydropteridine diphosphokinase
VSRAVLSIGSNLGDRLAYLQSVLDRLGGDGVAALAVSPVYQTAPWGGIEQDDYLNAVLVAASSALRPRDWLRLGQECERAAGRVREWRWGPRTLDVDIVDVDGESLDDADLTLPHPRAHERAFVLVPWLDVEPDATLTARGRVADLVAALPVAERDGVRRRDDIELVVRR